MSVLSYLEKLLDGVEVEWKALEDVGEFLRGKRFVKSDIKSEGVPCLHYGELYTHYGIWAEKTKSFLDEAVAEKLRVANYGDVVIVAAGETIEDIGNGTAWLGKSDVVFHDACFSFKSKLNPKYVSYYLRTHLFKEQIKSSISSGKISSINAKGLGKARIPIPCPATPDKSLAIQSEIVRVLDEFTAHTDELRAELSAELTMRKKQYNYYRDQLLSFDEGDVKWKILGEIAEVNTGQKPSEILENKAAFDYINAGTSRSGYTTVSNCDGDSVTTPSRGQGGIGFVGYQKVPFWLGPLCYKIKSINDGVLINKFLFYFLQSRNDLILALKKEAGVPAVNKSDLAKLAIPLPPLYEQKRIITILDEFYSLTHSISEKLPREIELRQQQYEYYRDLLFSFLNKDVNGAA